MISYVFACGHLDWSAQLSFVATVTQNMEYWWFKASRFLVWNDYLNKHLEDER